MGKRFIKFLPLFIIGMVFVVIVGGQIVMRLWNWLLPELFGWKAITFWQAWGILALTRILFGGMCGGYRGRRDYTPEQRARFRAWVYGKKADAGTGAEPTEV